MWYAMKARRLTLALSVFNSFSMQGRVRKKRQLLASMRLLVWRVLATVIWDTLALT